VSQIEEATRERREGATKLGSSGGRGRLAVGAFTDLCWFLRLILVDRTRVNGGENEELVGGSVGVHLDG
jgi:hypothetical protein